MDRVVWSTVLVLACVASLTMLTWREFILVALVALPAAIVATKAWRAVSERWLVGDEPSDGV